MCTQKPCLGSLSQCCSSAMLHDSARHRDAIDTPSTNLHNYTTLAVLPREWPNALQGIKWQIHSIHSQATFCQIYTPGRINIMSRTHFCLRTRTSRAQTKVHAYAFYARKGQMSSEVIELLNHKAQTGNAKSQMNSKPSLGAANHAAATMCIQCPTETKQRKPIHGTLWAMLACHGAKNCLARFIDPCTATANVQSPHCYAVVDVFPCIAMHEI